ncbi:hypothetical protein BKA67DRAFT_542591 [Truncatella angustata]|uniref:Uncharacterized protein n=1 Tax=Truncatella angustata TaxID=152316 RepID=A0A9P8RJX7_9PEZI|nr:uncharacterized protein BKA67DRAFT_542591 [Truncatella angustata]KAH6640065.1 hypothetical protein BKA67DRAFT_542591 [Truncatella angustata]
MRLWISQGPIDPVLGRDRAIDQNYIREYHNEQDYANEPWNHYKDAVEAYLSIREAHRKDFLRHVKDPKVTHEIERIDKSCNSFLTRPDVKILIDRLQKLKTDWKGEVVSDISQIRQERQAQLDETIKPEYKEYLRDWDEKHLAAIRPPKITEGIVPRSSWPRRRLPIISQIAMQLNKHNKHRSARPRGRRISSHPLRPGGI